MTTTTKKTTTRKKRTTTVKAKEPQKLPPNPFIHEILEVADKQRSKAKKVEVLKEYRNDALTAILELRHQCYHCSAARRGALQGE